MQITGLVPYTRQEPNEVKGNSVCLSICLQVVSIPLGKAGLTPGSLSAKMDVSFNLSFLSHSI
jgi:hypothetical protein